MGVSMVVSGPAIPKRLVNLKLSSYLGHVQEQQRPGIHHSCRPLNLQLKSAVRCGCVQ